MKKRHLLSICFIASYLFASSATHLWADVVAKLVVVNPSDSERRTVPVRYELPPDISKEDIINAGELTVDYDVEKSVYCVTGVVELDPKETRQFKIVLKDIWTIPEGDIIALRTMLEEKTAGSKKSSAADDAGGDGAVTDDVTIQLVAETLQAKLDAIIARQEEVADDITKRMKIHAANMANFTKLQNEVFSFDSLVKHGQIADEVEGVITLVIEAENVLDEEVTFPLEYYLPRELKPEDLIDTGNFQLQQNPKTDQLYLSAEETFKPQEIKRMVLKVRNVWYIPEVLLTRYTSEAVALHEDLSTTNVAGIAKLLLQAIQTNTETVLKSQLQEGAVKDKIAVFRLNQKRLATIKENLERLRSLKIQVEVKEQKTGGIKNILRQVDYLEHLKKISDNLFKEKIKKGFVWKIVMTIVVFLIVLTVFFYALWFLNLKKEQSRKMKVIK